MDNADAETILRRGAIELDRRLVDASNLTVRCRVRLEGQAVRGVYKPVSGERPLWDFPHGTLAGREVAAYLLSEATGWQLVPPTVLREGPLGVGACQLWIEQEPDRELVGFVPDGQVPDGWLPVARARDDDGHRYALAHADDPRLARMAMFDTVLNNADRKGGHLLVTDDDQLRGVDHGLCLHADWKLRTVLWGWAGTPLPEDAGPVLARLAEALEDPLGKQLAEHLTRAELAALTDRVAGLRGSGRFPRPEPGWPVLPWPPI